MNNRGSIAVMSALLTVPLLLSLGLAVDLSRLWLLQQRMQWAVDTAALLGASQVNGEAANLVTQDAQGLFWVSYGAPITTLYNHSVTQTGFQGSSSVGAYVTVTTVAVLASGNTPAVPPNVTVTASATLPTSIMRIMGPSVSTVTATGSAAVPHKVELALVLDNSLSMGLAITGSATKLAAVQTAANNLLTMILGSGSSLNEAVVIVPFAGAVNVGNNAVGQSFLKPATLALEFPPSLNPDLGWRGCVQARAYLPPSTSYDATEDAPTSLATQFTPYQSPTTYHLAPIPGHIGTFYTGDNDWTLLNVTDTSTAPQTTNTNYLSPTTPPLYVGPNLFCPQLPLVPLTNNTATLNATVNNMALVNGGGTVMNQGLQWGWFTISPLWTAWKLPPSPTGAARPAAYSDTGTTKIVVLMTDGVNEEDGIDTFYGAAATNQGNGQSNCLRLPNIYPECLQPSSWYNAYGRVSSGVLAQTPPTGTSGTALRTDAGTTLRTRFLALCSNIKAQNIVLYTIFFHGTADDTILGALTNGAGPDLLTCATDANHFFDSTSAAAINTAFQQIAIAINDLKLRQ